MKSLQLLLSAFHNALRKLDKHKASGPDGLPNEKQVLVSGLHLSLVHIHSVHRAVLHLHLHLIEYFKETQNKIKKAMIAALTPGLVLLPTAIGKYLVLRRSSEIIRADKSFLLCYFIRGGAIGLYRTMQSDFQNIWLFIGLSLLHGVSNVLSKLTLNLRIKIGKCFVTCVNKTRCGSPLEVLSVDTPRIRRFNADLEIQNILFEYTTVILSQAYLVLYLVMNFEVQAWQVIRGSLIRICISTAMDFVFNVISVFIQVHVYDIPMRRVWFKYWRRHVVANSLIIVIMISYFGFSLVSVFAARKTDQCNTNCEIAPRYSE